MSRERLSPRILADAILEVCRALRTSVPAPRGAPFLGLDLELAVAPGLLESLSGPGIFRKYEQVLLVGSRLGGSARWLSTRLGCRVVALAEDAETAAAGARLQSFSRHDGHVDIIAAESCRLPLRTGGVTHVWALGLPERARAETLAEAYRALRPGGQFALQWCGAPAASELASAVDLLASLGFEAIETHATTPHEVPSAFRLASDRLALEINRRTGLAGGVTAPPAMPASLGQLHARRPA